MKRTLIDITYNLLYKRGYCETNLKDITGQAKITKGSLYYHFTSKHDLVLNSMKLYLENILEEHWITPLENSQVPKETLIEQIRLYQAAFERGEDLQIQHGCPLSNFILDMSDKNDEYFEYLKSVYARWHGALEGALESAKSHGQTQRDFDVSSEAIFIISSLEGSITSAKAYNDISVLKNGFQVLINYIHTL